MTDKKDVALKLALEALSPWAGEDANHTEQYAAYHAIREALAEQPAQQETDSSRDEQEAPFEEWWEKHGQFLRAGGGQYEKTFAWHAWCESAKPAQQQEPVAWGNFKDDGTLVGLSQYPEDQKDWTGRKPLYTSPPQRKPWVGLTDEEIKKIWGSYFSRGIEFARAIEAKLKEKNA